MGSTESWSDSEEYTFSLIMVSSRAAELLSSGFGGFGGLAPTSFLMGAEDFSDVDTELKVTLWHLRHALTSDTDRGVNSGHLQKIGKTRFRDKNKGFGGTEWLFRWCLDRGHPKDVASMGRR